jgi:hypothetical protein
MWKNLRVRERERATSLYIGGVGGILEDGQDLIRKVS